MNKWRIPEWLETEVKTRDTTCVYCGVPMIEKMPPHGPRKTVATWEHIINDASIVTPENIARCCVACNSSKGIKSLADWMQSTYCKKRGINRDTVAEVVRKGLEIEPKDDVFRTPCGSAHRSAPARGTNRLTLLMPRWLCTDPSLGQSQHPHHYTEQTGQGDHVEAEPREWHAGPASVHERNEQSGEHRKGFRCHTHGS